MKAHLMSMLVLAATACAWQSSPVAMVGLAPDVSALAGEWSGEYRSGETQRWGTIWFRLEAGRDTAYGDVLMIPREPVVQMMPEATAPLMMKPVPRVLTIKFVRVEGGRITGAIEPYTSPDCECMLFTVFRGELRGDRIEGDFLILHTASDTPPRSGTWWAARKTTASR